MHTFYNSALKQLRPFGSHDPAWGRLASVLPAWAGDSTSPLQVAAGAGIALAVLVLVSRASKPELLGSRMLTGQIRTR